MKYKATSLFLGFCLMLLGVAVNPAYARSMTGFSSFHAETSLSTDPYTCLAENFGAVENSCGYKVSLEFAIPIDYPGSHTINVTNGWFGSTSAETFSCASYAYAGNGKAVYGTKISFTGPGQTLATTVDVDDGATSIQVICGMFRRVVALQTSTGTRKCQKKDKHPFA